MTEVVITVLEILRQKDGHKLEASSDYIALGCYGVQSKTVGRKSKI